MKPTIAYHSFSLSPNSVGGAPLFYDSVTKLLRHNHTNFSPLMHDLLEIVSDSTKLKEFIRNLSKGSTVVCTAGPYAYIYHYLRELSGSEFRIIRDVRTTAWTPYLLQERLCSNLDRHNDIIIYPSSYSKKFFINLFPESRAQGVISYPISDDLPFENGIANKVIGKQYRIGYLGRISEDKNFAHICRTFGYIAQRDSKCFFLIAGPIYPKSQKLSNFQDISRLMKSFGVPTSHFCYLGDLKYNDIWNFLKKLDVLYFPSLSSNESFGRVLVEASRMGIPVIASDFAATPELIEQENIVPCRHTLFGTKSTDFPFSFGEPIVTASVERLFSPKKYIDSSLFYTNQTSTYLDILKGIRTQNEIQSFSWSQTEAFLRSIRITGMPSWNRDEALKISKDLTMFYVKYFSKKSIERLSFAMKLYSENRMQGFPRKVLKQRIIAPNQSSALRNAIVFGRYINFSPSVSFVTTPADELKLSTFIHRQSSKSVKTGFNKWPSVTVIIPFYGEDLDSITSCILAINEQQYDGYFSIMLIDNNEKKVLKKELFKSSITIIHEPKIGSYAARNAGIINSDSSIIAFTDSDCVPNLTWLKEGVKDLMSINGQGLIAGKINIKFGDTRPNACEIYDSLIHLRQKQYAEEMHFAATANMITTSEMFRINGLFNDRLLSGGDKDWGQRLWDKGFLIKYSSATVSHPARRTLRDIRKKSCRLVGQEYSKSLIIGTSSIKDIIQQEFLKGKSRKKLIQIQKLQVPIQKRFNVQCILYLVLIFRLSELLMLNFGKRPSRI